MLNLVRSLPREPISCNKFYVPVTKLLETENEEVVVSRCELSSVVALREMLRSLHLVEAVFVTYCDLLDVFWLVRLQTRWQKIEVN